MDFILFMTIFFHVLLGADKCTGSVVRRYVEDELDAKFWYDVGEKTLAKILKQRTLEKPAKNVIYFLGDGMGIPTVTAARIYEGQKKGMSGEENSLSFDKFPYTGLAKTYNVDRQVPDSAGTSTAFLCGVKGNYYTLGVTARVKLDDCTSSLDETTHVNSIMKWAQDAGKATGFVTTMRVTHATPAGLYAHAANRSWESDNDIPKDQKKCIDIARQMVEKQPGMDCKVIMGGGRKKFDPAIREDGANLTEVWMNNTAKKGQKCRMITDLKDFLSVEPSETDCLLGLFNDDHLTYEGDWLNKPLTRDEPSISNMTKMAIEILKKSSNGFFLFVEGGKIDWAHHAGTARYALEETVAFSDAIQTAVDMVDLDETLVVVTADHSHVMTINGYPHRGADIMGTIESDHDDPFPGLTYTTLMYANGPGYSYTPVNGSEIPRDGEKTTSFEYHQLSAFPKKYETHGGEDVPVYAIGPMSHLFRGAFEQNYIPHAIGYAACYKGDFDKCHSVSRGNSPKLGKLTTLVLIMTSTLLNQLLFRS